MANQKTRIEREAQAAHEKNADGMARLLQTELIAHGIDLAGGAPQRRLSRDPDTTQVELRFDGRDTTNLEKLITILRRARSG